MSKTRQSLLHQFFLKLWYQQSFKSRLLSYCFLPLACLYTVIAQKKRKKDIKFAKPLSVPVIVVGNISVGGTGKTPVVIALAAALKTSNKRVGIISRGYGGSHEQSTTIKPLLVTPKTSVALSGDESLLIAQETQCPVVICQNRAAAAEYLLSTVPDVDVIISDDGLQHYKLYRSLEIVVVDNNRGLGNGYCLPAGPLRESVERLAQVDWILLNTAADDSCESTKQAIISALHINKPQLASVSLWPDQWFNIGVQAWHKLDAPKWYSDHKETGKPNVTAIAAIGNPLRFFDTLAALGIKADNVAFDDHHKFSANDFSASADNIVLMTSKDAVKCNDFANEYTWALNVSLKLPTSLIDDVLSLINKSHRVSSNKN